MAHSTLNDNIGPLGPQELMEAAGSGDVGGVGIKGIRILNTMSVIQQSCVNVPII
jgi:hypothetical protein